MALPPYLTTTILPAYALQPRQRLGRMDAFSTGWPLVQGLAGGSGSITRSRRRLSSMLGRRSFSWT